MEHEGISPCPSITGTLPNALLQAELNCGKCVESPSLEIFKIFRDSGHGLMLELAVLDLWLDLIVLKVFSIVKGTVFLCFYELFLQQASYFSPIFDNNFWLLAHFP